MRDVDESPSSDQARSDGVGTQNVAPALPLSKNTLTDVRKLGEGRSCLWSRLPMCMT